MSLGSFRTPKIPNELNHLKSTFWGMRSHGSGAIRVFDDHGFFTPTGRISLKYTVGGAFPFYILPFADRVSVARNLLGMDAVIESSYVLLHPPPVAHKNGILY